MTWQICSNLVETASHMTACWHPYGPAKFCGHYVFTYTLPIFLAQFATLKPFAYRLFPALCFEENCLNSLKAAAES
jgi:hypothetical protein